MDLGDGAVIVRRGKSGLARGLRLSRRARQALRRYLAERGEDSPDDLLLMMRLVI